MSAAPVSAALIDSPQAWRRLGVTLVVMTVGASGMYVVPVALPAVQAEFGISRADAALPYTLLMVGFGLGGILMGKLADRRGVAWVLRVGAVGLALGYAGAAVAGGVWTFALAHGLLIGLLGCASTFSPLLADTALWFNQRRGIAVAVCASGNYLGGAIWPPVVRWGIDTLGWRATYGAMAVVGTAVLLALAQALRQRPPAQPDAPVAGPSGASRERPFGLAPGTALVALSVAGLACCVAMAMPQVHIVAYCGDLGYGAARGAEMLALMLACGVVSRLVSGAICDRIGGLRTLMLGSALQAVALAMFLPVTGLVPLYVVSALFGLFQGGIVPSYAIIVREHFPAAQASAQVGTVIMATLVGMALGGWMSGKVFDLTGSYHAAFLNGLAWNALNFGVAAWLWWRTRRPR